MPPDSRIEIRSYRAVFDLERRLYRIDRFRLNPSGVPVRALIYVALLVVAMLVAQRLPVADWLLGALPWQGRYVALPLAGAALLTLVRIDGRPAHTALVSGIYFTCTPRHLSGFRRCPRPQTRWTPRRVGLIADGSDRRFGRLRFRGPGAVLVRAPHRLERRRRRLVLEVAAPVPSGEAGRVVVLRAGAILDVRARR